MDRTAEFSDEILGLRNAKHRVARVPVRKKPDKSEFAIFACGISIEFTSISSKLEDLSKRALLLFFIILLIVSWTRDPAICNLMRGSVLLLHLALCAHVSRTFVSYCARAPRQCVTCGQVGLLAAHFVVRARNRALAWEPLVRICSTWSLTTVY